MAYLKIDTAEEVRRMYRGEALTLPIENLARMVAREWLAAAEVKGDGVAFCQHLHDLPDARAYGPS